MRPGATVVGVDWRTSLADAALRVGPNVALQGNLDPVVLLAGWPAVERAARSVVDDGRLAVDAGAAGHIFNLGHGVLPATDPGAADRSGRPGAFAVTPDTYCVVGGGISGLVAAYRLRALAGDDADITVFDPADRLGGILRTERLGGQPMDIGAEAFVVRRPEVPALLAELGLAGRQISTTGVRPDDLQPGPHAPAAAGHRQRHPDVGGVGDRPGRRRDDRADGRRAQPAAALAARRRPGGRRRGRRPVRRAGGGALGGPDAVRRLRRLGGHHRHPLRGADAGRRPRRRAPPA